MECADGGAEFKAVINVVDPSWSEDCDDVAGEQTANGRAKSDVPWGPVRRRSLYVEEDGDEEEAGDRADQSSSRGSSITSSRMSAGGRSERRMVPADRVRSASNGPRAKAPTQAPAGALWASPTKHFGGAVRVLSADDDELCRRAARMLFQLVQAECDVVPDGASLIARLSADPSAFDIVVVDAEMGEGALDGRETIAQIEQLFARLKVPPPLLVLLLASARDDESDREAVELVAPGVLVFRKPLTFDLVQTILLNRGWLTFKRAALDSSSAPVSAELTPLDHTGGVFFGSAVRDGVPVPPYWGGPKVRSPRARESI